MGNTLHHVVVDASSQAPGSEPLVATQLLAPKLGVLASTIPLAKAYLNGELTYHRKCANLVCLSRGVHPKDVCRGMCRTPRATMRQYGLFRDFDKVLPCGLGCGQVIDFRWCSLLFNLPRCDNA
jgi:hypothetical protein